MISMWTSWYDIILPHNFITAPPFTPLSSTYLPIMNSMSMADRNLITEYCPAHRGLITKILSQ